MDWKKYWTDEKIIAIDPGANGGIAVWSVTGNAMIEVIKMPPTPAEVLEAVTSNHRSVRFTFSFFNSRNSDMRTPV